MDAPVSGHHFALRCIPESDERQQILSLQADIKPYDFLSSSRDAWGNWLIYGSCREPLEQFTVNIEGTAQTGRSDGVPETAPNRMIPFRHATPLTAADESLTAFAGSLRLPQAEAREQAICVMHAVHEKMYYRSGSTSVYTTAAEAFAAGSGVCQDYAHVMLAVLRAQGIPARYAVGMLSGEGESHAWVEVLSGNRWYGFDPTNDVPVMDQHIKFSHGRDYLDCRINRGIFRGTAGQETKVSVMVSETV